MAPSTPVSYTHLQALTATKSYLLICAWGIPFIIGYNAVSGILRGLGNSKTPLLFIAISCGINIISDFIFVAILQMGATGAAISTVFAQGLGLIFIFLYLTGKKLLQKYNISQPQFSVISAHKILLAGIPIALQEGLVNASFLVITAIINHLGLIASAAVGVAEKLILFSMLPTTAFASAIAAITAQHHGAGLIKRGRQCLYTGIAIALVFGIACFLLAQQYAPFFMGIFTKDQAVIQAGAAYLHSYSLDCIIVCFVFCLNTYFSGSGHPIFPLVHSIISTCLVRIPLSWLLSLQPEASLFQIGMAAPAASLLSLLLCQYYLWRTKKQLSFPQ